MTATPKQIGLIHGLKKSARLDDENYRAVLKSVAGVDSAKLLSVPGAIKVIDRLKVLAGQEPGPRGEENGHRTRSRAAKGAMELGGPYAGKLRALWISGYHLGVVGDRSDEALAAFVKRQTGIDHPTWIKNAFQATKVIEGLKAWIGREAGLDWPSDSDLHAVKVAIVNACWRRAIACGACRVLCEPDGDLAFYATRVVGRPNRTVNDIRVLTEAELDKVAAAIGARMRKHLAPKIFLDELPAMERRR